MYKSLFFLALLAISSSFSILSCATPAQALLTYTFGTVDAGGSPYADSEPSWEDILDFDEE